MALREESPGSLYGQGELGARSLVQGSGFPERLKVDICRVSQEPAGVEGPAGAPEGPRSVPGVQVSEATLSGWKPGSVAHEPSPQLGQRQYPWAFRGQECEDICRTAGSMDEGTSIGRDWSEHRVVEGPRSKQGQRWSLGPKRSQPRQNGSCPRCKPWFYWSDLFTVQSLLRSQGWDSEGRYTCSLPVKGPPGLLQPALSSALEPGREGWGEGRLLGKQGQGGYGG